MGLVFSTLTPLLSSRTTAFTLHTDLVDVSKVTKVPITFFTATNDEVCQHKVAMEYIPLFQSETTQIDVEDEGHLYFSDKANTEWFMEQLTAQLQVPTTVPEQALM